MTINHPEWWNGYGKQYPLISRLLPFWESLTQVIEAAGIRNDSRVLDAGCGTGFLKRALRGLGLNPSLVELDFSPVMLAQARAEPYDGPAVFVEADLNGPPSRWGLGPEAVFSKFVLNNSLYALDDPTGVLRGLHGLATPDAVMVVSTPRNDPSMGAILEAHLSLFAQTGGDPIAERDELLLKAADLIAYNEELLPKGLTMEQLVAVFAYSGWEVDSVTTTYAGQNWLVVATRGDL